MTDYTNWQDKTVIDQDGNKLGTITQLYVDGQTAEPTWATIKSGFFGTKQHFIPISKAQLQGDDIVVPVSKDLVENAPGIEADNEISEAEEARLYEYYNSANASDSSDDTGHDVSGPNTDDAMTRSEEQLRVGTHQEEVGRVRLQKYIVTENVQKTIPLQHEEVRMVTEPITDENRAQATSGANLSEEEHEVVLTAERPVISKETVPVERVKLDTETVTEEHTVNEDVRREQIDVAGDGEKR